MTQVLTIYYKHKPGGFCKRLKMKIEAYLEQGWKVHYIAVEAYPYSHPNLVPHILASPFKNHDTIYFWSYFFFIVPFFALWIAGKEKIQLISIFSLSYACLAAPAKWITNTPLLTFIRTLKGNKNSSISPFMFKIERILDKIGFAASDLLIANCESIKNELIKSHNPKKDIQILYNNIEEHSFDKQKQKKWLLEEFGIREDSFVLVTTGLLIPRKNQHCLLKAFSKVETSRGVLIVVGEGPLQSSLQNFAEELKLRDKVIFTGWRDDVKDILAGCDLFVFSSYLEGLSNSILEAIACEVPCIVSDISENTEAIQDPEQHFPPDSPGILAEKITRAMQDPKYYQDLTFKTCENKNRFIFDWDKRLIQKAALLLQEH